MDFKEALKNYQQQINQELEKYEKKQKCPEQKLNQAMEYSLNGGGKRIRPILTIATYQIFKKDIEKCFPYAIAIEMAHNFSLIHDDLPGIDNDDFRHGKPTNHKKFNEATAILAGDGLLNYAYSVMSKDLKNSKAEELPKKIQILAEFTEAIDRMIAGEYVDTEMEKQKITTKELKYIHENKTASMFKISIRMGAILAECGDRQLEKLTNYASKIGLAFQIKDDILSEEGKEEILGKPVGRDKELEKCTYVSQYGLQKAKKILEDTIKEATKQIEEFGEKAKFLEQLAIYIQNRNK